MISTAESQQKTRELFSLEQHEDLSFITEEFLAAEAPNGAELTDFPRVQYGSGMAYGSRNDRFTYETFAGVKLPNYPHSSAQGVACGANRWHYYQDEWEHENISSYCGGNTHNQFHRIFKLTYRK